MCYLSEFFFFSLIFAPGFLQLLLIMKALERHWVENRTDVREHVNVVKYGGGEGEIKGIKLKWSGNWA